MKFAGQMTAARTAVWIKEAHIYEIGDTRNAKTLNFISTVLGLLPLSDAKNMQNSSDSGYRPWGCADYCH